MTNEAVNRILQMLKEHCRAVNEPMAAVRQDFDKFYAQFHTTKDLKVNQASADKVPAFWIEAPKTDSRAVILFFHGGGFTIGSTRDHLELCGRLSRAASARVLSIDYRLAPEHPFPAAVEDCLASYQWLLKQKDRPTPIFIAGISAGATLTLATLIGLRDQGLPLPVAAVCMSPLVDLLLKGASLKTNQGKDWITLERIQAVITAYMAGQDLRQPWASPLYADLSGLPPLLIQVGSHELLLDDGLRLAQKARDQGVNVHLEIWEEMVHCWQVFAAAIPQGQQAIDKTGTFIRARLT